MPDFRKIVCERVAPLRLQAAEESNLIEELTQHLEYRFQDLCAAGETEAAAWRMAVSELDDMYPIQAEMTGSQRIPKRDPVPLGGPPRASFFADLLRDLRYTARTMRKNPLFVAFVVLTLALGIGANTTVFSVIDTLILNPLPVRDSSSLAALSTAQDNRKSKSVAPLPLSYVNLKDLRAANQVFSEFAAYTSPRVATLQISRASQRMFAELVTGNYFAALGLHPAAGRFFSPEEDGVPGAHPVAVINYATWQMRFGGEPDIVGKTLRLNNTVFTVIGVAPPRFIGVNAVFGPDLWIPAAMSEQLLPVEMSRALSDRAKAVFMGVARLKPGVSRAQAQADIATLAAAQARDYPQANQGRTVVVRPVRDAVFGSAGMGSAQIVFGSAVLLAVVGIVLLIACSNVANLLIARSANRQPEMAVRLAMGASRARLIRQLLTESVVLGLLSGAAGFCMGYAGSNLLWSFRPAEVAANMTTPRLDPTMFAFALLVSLFTGFVFGVVPALRATRTNLSGTLKDQGRTATGGRGGVTFANALLVGQVAFSFVSLVTAGLFLRSIERAYAIDPGFDTRHLAVFLTNPGQAGYAKPQAKAFYKEAGERVAALPGVESVSWASNLPLWGRVESGLEVEGRQPQSKADVIATVVNTVDAGFFRTAGIALDEGRDFAITYLESSAPVAIVNQKLAHDYWPGEPVLGKRIRLPGEKEMRQVIGVAKTANYSTLAEPPQACVYLPLEQNYADAMVLYVRSAGDPQQILLPVQREVRTAWPQVSVDDARTVRTIVGQALSTAKMGVALLLVFGLLALGLASIGLYGIMAYSVACRRREIGVRMALGAAQTNVLRLILRQGMSLVLLGVIVGLAASLAAGRLLARALYGVGAADPISIGTAAIVLLFVALAACYLPARAASRLDPLAALREG